VTEVEGRTQLFAGSYDQASRYRDYDVTRDGQTMGYTFGPPFMDKPRRRRSGRAAAH
jgi:hypothetical protein